MRADVRTVLLVSLFAAFAALASPRGAVFALAALALEATAAGVRWRTLGARLVPVGSGFAVLLVLMPLAPGPVLDVGVRGLAVAAAVALLGSLSPWSEVIGALQGAGLPRAPVAFLVILARHAETVREEAHQRHRALLTRGGYDRLANLGRSTGVLVAGLLDHALRRADEVAAALELRGFDGRVPGLPRWRPRIGETPFYALIVLLAAVAMLEASPWRH